MEKLLKDKVINTFIEVDYERCKGCLLCIYACPEGVIDLSNNFNTKGWTYVEPTFNEKCTGCRKCALVCPDLAIKVFMGQELIDGPKD